MKLNFTLNTLFDACGNIDPSLSNGKQRKIKRRLKTLFDYMSNYGMITMKWVQFPHFEGLIFVFSHGTISSVCFASDGTIRNVYHENYLQSKLAPHRVCCLEMFEHCILISYLEPFLTYISLEDNFKTNKKYLKFKLKSTCSIKTINLDRSNNRNLSKHNLTVSKSFVIIWWNTTLFSNYNGRQSPNLFLFSLDTLQIVASDTIDGEIIKNNFVQSEQDNFGVLYRPSNTSFSLTYLVFEITHSSEALSQTSKAEKESNNVRMKIVFSASIPLDKTCIYAEFTNLQDKILLLCDDESVMLFNIEQNVLYSLHSSMPVCYFAANSLDAIFVTSNQYGRLSIYDYAFNNIALSIRHKTSNYNCLTKLDVLNCGMSIKRLVFLSPQLLALVLVNNRRQDTKSNSTSGSSFEAPSCQLLLLTLSQQVDHIYLTHEYLNASKHEEALDILRIINWNCSFEQAYYCLNVIFQYFLQLPLNSQLESQIESTLATFLIPCTPIDYKIFEQILPFIRHLAIRFFYHLIRHQSYTKAYQLGIELKSRRHFLLLYQIAKQKGLHDLKMASYRQAQKLN